jgi:hypothetical protein
LATLLSCAIIPSMQPNPYGDDLGSRDPLQALAETPGAIGALVEGWGDDGSERSYAPGKWSARQVLIHLAQTELALTTRARFALSTPGYVAQNFDQNDWMPLDDGATAKGALDAYLSLRRFNIAMFRRLTAEQRERRFHHPEYGELSVGWILAQIAGHDLHHLAQLQRIV